MNNELPIFEEEVSFWIYYQAENTNENNLQSENNSNEEEPMFKWTRISPDKLLELCELEDKRKESKLDHWQRILIIREGQINIEKKKPPDKLLSNRVKYLKCKIKRPPDKSWIKMKIKRMKKPSDIWNYKLCARKYNLFARKSKYNLNLIKEKELKKIIILVVSFKTRKCIDKKNGKSINLPRICEQSSERGIGYPLWM
jgi:hypothetical protein